MDKIWLHDDLPFTNVDEAFKLLSEGNKIDIEDYIHENINSSQAKRIRLTLIGLSAETARNPAIF